VIQFRASGVRVKRATTAPSLVAMTTTQVPIIAWEQRYMTPSECARLQSMGNLKYLPTGLTAMEAFGNAVNVTVVELILRPLLKSERSEQADALAVGNLTYPTDSGFRSASL
jgi:DNA (cytosine-5)-methyltransferase 1